MKRRVLIAKALSHDPELLFLDEPTAGVDVELRRDMWRQIDRLRDAGVTVILTTHYIEEAQEMADRVGVIDKGRLLLVDDKDAIMARLGRTEARFRLAQPLGQVPDSLCAYPLTLRTQAPRCAIADGDGAGKGKAEIAAVRRRWQRPDIAYTASTPTVLAGRYFRRARRGESSVIGWRSTYAIYRNELVRFMRTVFGSLVSPVLTTSLYFIVFGAAIGGRMSDVGGVDYGAFIVPGLLMLTLLSESTSNASFGIYMPRFTGAIYELLSAPVGVGETLLGFVGAAATKSLILASVILLTATLFVDYSIAHPFYAFLFIILVSASFSLLGFILGIWAEGFEKLQMVPMLILTPLTFLGRNLLLDRHAGGALAHGRAVQSHRIPRERPALDVLRQGRRQHRGLTRSDARVPRRVRRRDRVDLPQRLAPAQLVGELRAFEPGIFVRHEPAREPLEEARADAIGEALRLVDAGIPFSDSVRSYKAILGHCSRRIPEVRRGSGAIFDQSCGRSMALFTRVAGHRLRR